jgi:Ca2+-dependent lipid-binding protein
VTPKNLGFAEALETLGEKNAKLAKGYASCECNQSLLSPISSSLLFKTKKKGKEFVVVLLCCVYGFFLSKSKPTMAIAMIITITATTIP